MVEVDGVAIVGRRLAEAGRLHEHQALAFRHGVAHRHRMETHDAIDAGGDEVLHLHGLQHRDGLVRPDLRAHRDGEADHRSLKRRLDRLGSGRPRHVGRASVGGARGVQLEVHRRRRKLRGGGQLAGPRFHERRGPVPRHEDRIAQDGAQERDVGRRAFDPELGQRPVGGAIERGRIARRIVDDHLGQQGVEPDAGRVPGVTEAVHPDAGARRRLVGGQDAAGRTRRPVVGHTLQVHPRLDRDTACGRRTVRETQVGQTASAGHSKLKLHEVQSRHRFRHGVLNLQPRVGLDKGVSAARLHQELDGSDPAVTHRPAQFDGRLQQPKAHRRVQPPGRRQFDDLLALALDAAVAIPEVDDLSRAIAQNLHFDMTRAGHQPFDIEVAHTEGRQRLGGAAFIGRRQVLGPLDGPHASPAAAAHSLDHPGAPRSQAAQARSRPGKARRPLCAVQGGDAAMAGDLTRRGLVAERVEGLGFRPHEGEAGVSAGPRERRRLAEEAVAGVHGVGAGGHGSRENARRIQICGRSDAAERHGLVRPAHMQGAGVVLRVHGDGREPQPRGRTRDADGDFAAVGDQKLFHGTPTALASPRVPRAPGRPGFRHAAAG